MHNVVGVRLKSGCKIYTFDSNKIECKKNDHVIVDTSRGMEYANVVIPNKDIEDEKLKEPLKKVLRKATLEDDKRNQEHIKKEKEAYEDVKKRISNYQLNMNLVNCEYLFDDSKIIFNFTSDERVDFRELVKEIASIYKTRIELRQIGARDEVKMLGDCGVCGNSLCCATFLNDMDPVSIKMAKEQGLALNPQKISGLCGRLMCCLKYEQCVYDEKNKRLPKHNAKVKTPDGVGIVQQVEILPERVKVKFGKDEETTYKVYDLKDISIIK